MSIRTIVIVALCCAGLGAGSAAAKSGNCPPGLAKKAIPCVPPGLAKKLVLPGDGTWHGDEPDQDGTHHHEYHVGDWVPGDVTYIIVKDYGQYGLPPPLYGSEYLRIGDQFYRVGTDTRQVIALVQVLGSLLN